ncbi:hypothetical protein ACK8HX_14680 [Oryzobacter sp. R7]|uniref:hypothetical protein n=1 Tax=Oryzobacter faecalis TaxID=3388656 RepID=UPI00398CEAB5
MTAREQTRPGLAADRRAPGARPPAGGDVAPVAVVTLALVILVSTVAGWVGLSPLRSPGAAGGLLLVAVVAAAVLVVLTRPRAAAGGTPRTSAVVLALPALGVGAVTAVGAVLGVPRGIAWFLNGDHTRHLVYVADTWAQGALSYSVESYPHGWHALLAAGWAVTGAGLDPDALVRLVRLMALASLLLSVLLALAMAHLAHSVLDRLGTGARGSVLGGLLVGAGCLLTFVLANYQALGYENSLLAAVVVATSLREVVLRAGSPTSLVVTGAGVVVTAHAWQLLLPSVALAALWCGWRALAVREGAPRKVLVAVLALGVPVALPGVLAVVRAVGLDHAAEAGPDSPVPLPLVVLAVVLSVAVAAVARDAVIACAAVATALPAATALALSAVLGVGLLEYYPSKLLWQSAVLGLLWVVVAGALAGHGLLTQAPAVRPVVRVVGGVAAALFVLWALVLPWGSLVGTWATVDAARVLAALRTPGAPDATVVWLQATPTSDSVTRSLLDAYRVGETRERMPQARQSVEAECVLLGAAAAPVILTTASEAEARQRYSCAPAARVVRVSLPPS